MTTVFIAGSISISRLHEKVQERISKIVSSGFDVVVGDADGADTSIQECLLKHRARKVTVYCAGDAPRNNVADWPVHKVISNAKPGTRAYFTAKDLEMARRSDYGLMIWDCKSTGTLSNVIQLLKEHKKSVVFVNKNADFVNIGDRAGLDHLLTFMSAHARAKAEDKIGLSSKVASLGQERLSFDAPAPTPTSPRPEPAPAALADSVVGGALLEAHRTAEAEAGPSSKISGRRKDQPPLVTPTSELAPSVHEPAASTPKMTPVAAVLADESLADSQNMKLRSALILALKEHISRTHLSQSQAAKVFGVTQPRISDLTREKVDLFGLDALVNMAATAGLRVEMHVHQAEPFQTSGVKSR